MKELIIHLTKGKIAILKYPENITEEDIRIIESEIEIDKIPTAYRSASITIKRGNKETSIMRETIAECEKYRLEKYPDWVVINSYEFDNT